MLDIKTVGKRLGETKDLPKELVKQLKKSKCLKTRNWLIKMIDEDFGGAATIDEILIAYYRKTGNIGTRVWLTSLAQWCRRNGELYKSVDGVYCTDKKIAKFLKEER